MDVLLGALIGLTVAVGAVVVSYKVRQFLLEKNGYPREDMIELALMPFIQNAILFAYKESERHFDAVGERLAGIDKKLLADRVYDLLPDSLVVGGRVVPISFVKTLVPRERFAQAVQWAFDTFLEWYEDVYRNFADELAEFQPK